MCLAEAYRGDLSAETLVFGPGSADEYALHATESWFDPLLVCRFFADAQNGTGTFSEMHHHKSPIIRGVESR